MKLEFLEEPELQFGDGTHIDIRAGLYSYGALDRDEQRAPKRVRVGIVGTSATVQRISEWIASLSGAVISKEERLQDLRPTFPGASVFDTDFLVSEQCTRTLSRRDLDLALADTHALEALVNGFAEHARDLAEAGGVDVIVVAPPAEVFVLSEPKPKDEAALDEGSDEKPRPYVPSFHDVFKARVLGLAVPCQVVRPDTYGGGRTRRSRRRQSLQDDATRAWNFSTALYYKAGGMPWRLVRRSAALATCHVGVSFFKAVEGDRLLTSVAQVFDERGEGIILQGGAAKIDKHDRVPHLVSAEAHALIRDSLACYRREHRTIPARLVVHKTSGFDSDEVDGCRAAADEAQVDLLELVSVRRSGFRLFRTATFPVLRGTLVNFDDESGALYLRGSVPQFKTYPGMYIPSSLEFQRWEGESSPLELAREMLELSKLNFNNTQFDGGEPITVRAARRVGDILKHLHPEQGVRARFRFFT